MNDAYKAIATVMAACMSTPVLAQPAPAETALVAALDQYEPGSAIDPATLARIDEAARTLEQSAPAPDLASTDLADGLWITRFSSQGIVGEIDVSFMTRSLPGAGVSGGTALVDNVWQELRLADGFYRNTMLLRAGPERVPVLYLATADLTVSPEQPNDLLVAFKEFIFAPGSQEVTPAQVRRALNLADDTPLAVQMPEDTAPPPSASKVTYLSEEFRINRGTSYVAIMQKVR